MQTALMALGVLQLVTWAFWLASVIRIDRSGNSGRYESKYRDDVQYEQFEQ